MTAGAPILEARPAMRSFTGSLVALGALAVVVWALGFMSGTPVPGVVIVGGGLLPLLVGVAYAWLVRVGNQYRVFDESLEMQSGIVARNIDNVQLFRVRDLGLSQSIVGRVLGFCDVTVTSTDQSAPHIVLRGVRDPRRIYEALRGLVARSQATRRTMILEQEPPSAAAPDG